MVRSWKSLSAAMLIVVLTFVPAEAGQWILSRISSAPSTAIAGGHVENDDPNQGDGGEADSSSDGSLLLVGGGAEIGTPDVNYANAGGGADVIWWPDDDDFAQVIAKCVGFVTLDADIEHWVYGETAAGADGFTVMEIDEVQAGGTFSLTATITITHEGTGFGFAFDEWIFGAGGWIYLDDFSEGNGLGLGVFIPGEVQASNPEGPADYDYSVVGNEHIYSVTYTWYGLSSADLPTVTFDASSGVEASAGFASDVDGYAEMGFGVTCRIEIIPD